jgi:serine/threonine protein kinase
MSADQKQSMKICSRCRKIIRSGQKGTFTAWIFGGNPCKCGDGNGQIKRQDGDSHADILKQERYDAPAQFQSQAQSNSQLQTDSTVREYSQIKLPPPGAEPVSQRPNLGPRFEILDFLGEGGMGSVYKIREIETGKIFAAKILKEFLANDLTATRRFEQEVRAASELTHPNLVFIYGSYRSPNGTPYMVMNFVDGISLGELLKFEHYFPYQRALLIFAQVADALVHAHSKGIVHRDLKPNNILIYQHESRRDAVRVVDFGIAKIINPDSNKTEGFTQTGEIFGSPLYMSPEQCFGEKLDARSDIYSLGCVMFHTLYGAPPFNDSNPMKIMLSHMNSPPTLTAVSKSKNVPKDVEKVVMRCLAKSPSARYQNSEALARDLNAILAGNGISGSGFRTNLSASHWKTIAIVAISVLVSAVTAVGATLYFVHRTERVESPNAVPSPLSTTSTPPPRGAINDEDALGSTLPMRDTGLRARIAHDQEILSVAKPIESTTSIVDGRKLRKFVFPSVSLGALCRYADLDVSSILAIQAKNTVYIPPDVPVTLAVRRSNSDSQVGALLTTPSIFAKINSGEFYGLSLKEDTSLLALDDELKAKNLAPILLPVSKWKNLKMISLRDFEVVDKVFPVINQMKELRYFQLIRCTVNSNKSVDQPFWGRLQGVRMGILDNGLATTIIKRLSNSQNLEKLGLVQVHADLLGKLSGCSKLRALDVQQVAMTDEMIKAIGGLKGLRRLSLYSCPFSNQQLRDLLSQNPNLTAVILSSSQFSATMQQKLQAIDSRIYFKSESAIYGSLDF